MNNAHVFIARLVRAMVRHALAPAQQTAGVTVVGSAGVTVSGRVFELPAVAAWLPSLASAPAQKTAGVTVRGRNDGGGRSRS